MLQEGCEPVFLLRRGAIQLRQSACSLRQFRSRSGGMVRRFARGSQTVSAVNPTARPLARHPDAALRNGGEAVTLAEQAARLTGNGDPAVLETLAAAYAENRQIFRRGGDRQARSAWRRIRASRLWWRLSRRKRHSTRPGRRSVTQGSINKTNRAEAQGVVRQRLCERESLQVLSVLGG